MVAKVFFLSMARQFSTLCKPTTCSKACWGACLRLDDDVAPPSFLPTELSDVSPVQCHRCRYKCRQGIRSLPLFINTQVKSVFWCHKYNQSCHVWSHRLCTAQIKEVAPIIGEGNGNPLQCSCWRIPGTGEPGGLLSLGSHRVRHDWSDLAAAPIIAIGHPAKLLSCPSWPSPQQIQRL